MSLTAVIERDTDPDAALEAAGAAFGGAGGDAGGAAGGDAGGVPDAGEGVDLVGRVVAVADAMARLAADRFARIDEFRLDALADTGAGTGRYGSRRDVVERSLRLELACALRVSENTAAGLLHTAEALRHRYRAAWESLHHARLTEQHVRILVDHLDQTTPELAARLLPDAVRLAESLPAHRFRARLAALIDTAAADTLTTGHEHALTARHIRIEADQHGMAWLSAYLPAVAAHAIHDRLTRIAHTITRHPENTRTIDQVRVDAFTDLLIDGDTTTHPDQAHGIRPTITITVPALTLLHHTTAGAAGADTGPAILDGAGPIPLTTAAELAGAAEGWMRILTHPHTGTPLAVDRDQYRPPAHLRRLIRWRAERCLAPGCTIPAHRCDIDHTTPWEHGGATGLNNLNPLCRGHHTLKHHGGWTVTPDPDGTLHWTSPTGRHYHAHPAYPYRSPRPPGSVAVAPPAEPAPPDPAPPGLDAWWPDPDETPADPPF